ncbi:MAG: hypothetical protein GWO16_00140, partial [Gammaproteobacteria bacterium]|nr:hypothetical protein [Pseudomonadales bacterium]NIP71529.1 hypothetical protein [Gammaproteobacteria bacterium]NIX06947.1 hypothetical protein [Pseudomonadales bacterium]
QGEKMLTLAEQLGDFYEQYEKITSSLSLKNLIDVLLRHDVDLTGEGAEIILAKLAEQKKSFRTFELAINPNTTVNDIELTVDDEEIRVSSSTLDGMDVYEYNN